VGPNVPIIELHVVRGAAIKGRTRGILRSVVALLWDDTRLSNLDRWVGQ
jgi:hypothetical protein